MPYKERRRRNSVNKRDIVGGLQSGGIAIVGNSTASGAGSGRLLIAEYENNGDQSVNLLSKTHTSTLLNMSAAVQSIPEVGTNTTPFTFTADDDKTLWVEAEVLFMPSANSGRYVLAVRSGTATSKSDSAYTFAVVTRGAQRWLFVQGVVDVKMGDEFQIALRSYNEASASETLTVKEARVWVYVV
jgi:hypothetical protein